MATYNLFSAVTGPPANGGGPNTFSLSTEFSTTSQVSLTQLRYYKATAVNYGTPTGQLFTVTTGTTGAAVTGTAVTFPASPSTVGAGWQTVTLTTPKALTVGQRYRVIVNFPVTGNFPQTSSYFTSGPGSTTATIGPLTLYSNSAATGNIQGGSIVSTTVQYTTASGGACHWVDVTVADAGSASKAASGWFEFFGGGF